MKETWKWLVRRGVLRVTGATAIDVRIVGERAPLVSGIIHSEEEMFGTDVDSMNPMREKLLEYRVLSRLLELDKQHELAQYYHQMARVVEVEIGGKSDQMDASTSRRENCSRVDDL